MDTEIWYHGSAHEGWLDCPYYIHVGTEAAALHRANPENWDVDDAIACGYYDPAHARIYVVKLDPAATIDPVVYNDDYGYGYLVDSEVPEVPEMVAVPGRNHHRLVQPHPYDVLRYVNAVEDRGNVSLLVNPERLTLVEVYEPVWSNLAVA